ncbi:hypothetical protein HWE02_08025 [Pseudomonas oryzihabitans]|uniref:hypothetical protein n=1 Tax=Pseudomonas oryzihabitans TaxID=47885 RepID=UPI001F521A80|nr:hypothetical protein [Pseudomonas oryzihabitans]MCI1009210.1 hypothetical protein [Pseudomonas oryzihabitans]
MSIATGCILGLPMSELSNACRPPRFSEQQLAVAHTWASHFKIDGPKRDTFIDHYLRSTRFTRCWSVSVQVPGRASLITILRLGHLVQLYDGVCIRTKKVKAIDRMPKRKPAEQSALRLARYLLLPHITWPLQPLMTSFCDSARSVARQLACDDLEAFGKAWDIDGHRHNRYFSPRTAYYLTQIGAALKAFLAEVDQPRLFAIRSANCPSAELYNWLSRGNSERRHQALRSQPILVPLLVLCEDDDWPIGRRNFDQGPAQLQASLRCYHPNDTTLAEALLGTAVDAGLPLVPLLAWVFRAPAASIRFLGSVRPNCAGTALGLIKREGRGLGWLGLLVGAQLGNRRPQNRRDWRAIHELHRCVPYSAAGAIDWSRLLAGTPTAWDDPRWPGIRATLTDVRELLSAVCDESPSAQRAAKGLEDFLGRSSYAQIARLVHDFHEAMTKAREFADSQGPLRETDAHTSWPPLLSKSRTVDCPNGLQILELVCPADLMSEHLALGHCIDNYDYRAYSGACRLFSVRESGRALASAELVMPLERLTKSAQTQRMTRSPSELQVVQLRGRLNRAIAGDEPAGVAFDWFMTSLRRGRLSVALEWPDVSHTLSRFAKDAWRMHYQRFLWEWLTHRLGLADAVAGLAHTA